MVNKYQQYREIAKSGDIILTHAKKPIAWTIREITNSYWHHCEIVNWSHTRLEGFGAHIDDFGQRFLSVRFKEKGWDDFTVLRPQVSDELIEQGMAHIYARAEKYHKYDKKKIVGILLEWLGIKNNIGDKNYPICSEMCGEYCKALGIDNNIVVPEDLLLIDERFLKKII